MAIAELPPRVTAPPAEVPRAVERPRRWTLTLEQCAYLGLVALALLVHLYALGDGALHHDETHHANFSWRLFAGLGYIHEPLLHGPLLYHIGALIFFLFGDNNTTARLGPALFGTALVAMPYLIRRELGRGAALLAAVYLLISPAYLYWGRHIRHDMYAVTFEFLAFISLVRYASTRRALWLYVGAAALGLMFTTMETFFLYIAMFVPLLTLVLFWRVWRPGIVALLALGLALVALVFVVPGKPSSSGGGVVQRTNGTYVCPSAGEPFPPDNPIQASPGPIFGFGPLPTTDNNYALCVSHQDDDNFGVYLIKLAPFFGHPAILLALAISAVGMLGLYLLVWRRRDAAGTTAWQRARAANDGVLEAFASLATGRRVLVALGIFFTIYALFFTAFLTHPTGVISGTTGSLLYWLAQHGVGRGSQPWYYYLILLGIYEPLLVVWGMIGLIMVGAMVGGRLRRRTQTVQAQDVAALQEPQDVALQEAGAPSIDWPFALPVMLAWWAIATLGLYSWAGEKMPWLTIHVALPLVLLSAWAFARTIDWWRAAAAERGPLLRFAAEHPESNGVEAPALAAEHPEGNGVEAPALAAEHPEGNGVEVSDDQPAPQALPSGNGRSTSVPPAETPPRRPMIGALPIYLIIFGVIVAFCFQSLTIFIRPNDAQQWRVPFVLLSGLALVALLTIGATLLRRGRWALGALAIAVTLLGVFYSLRSSYQLNFLWPDDARERMIFVQTSPDAGRVLARLEQAATRRGGGRDMPIWYDNETIWAWYLRRFTNKQQQPEALTTPPGPEVQAVLMLQENIDSHPQNLQNLQGFRVQRYPLRWWFPNEGNGLSPDWMTAPIDDNSPLLMRLLREPLDGRSQAQLWRYLIYRQAPDQLGSSDFVIAVRPELANEIGLGTGGETDK
jgi:predicted membrane-bound mannosyltransferase